MLLVIIYKSFDLCHDLPNAVMGWIGGQSKDLGEREGGAKVMALGAAGSSQIQGSMTQGALRESNKDPKGGGEPKTADDAGEGKVNTPPVTPPATPVDNPVGGAGEGEVDKPAGGAGEAGAAGDVKK
ncbi:MAG: hypothetical protein Q9M14_06000 [Mariprofundaceae bacterium]|nr:hypothetical protein [Mariprofundaceae bacterium]